MGMHGQTIQNGHWRFRKEEGRRMSNEKLSTGYNVHYSGDKYTKSPHFTTIQFVHITKPFVSPKSTEIKKNYLAKGKKALGVALVCTLCSV